MREDKKCPCCPNHCDKNNLGCGKGKEYFKINDSGVINDNGNHFEEDETSMTLEEIAVYKIRKCGHYLHHSNKSVDLKFLSDEEQKNLISILSKCLNNWK